MSEPIAAVKVTLMADGQVTLEAGGGNNVIYLGLLEMGKTLVHTAKPRDESPIVRPVGMPLPFKAS
jgi:hypothetical protein